MFIETALPRLYPHQPSAQRGDFRIVPDSANPELVRRMVAKPDLAGRMRGYVLRLDAHSPVRSGEQQVIGEQPVQRDDIGSELRKTQFTSCATISGSVSPIRTRESSMSTRSAVEKELMTRYDHRGDRRP